MDSKEVADIMQGLAGALSVIESVMELSQQTNRLHNILNRTELLEIAGNAVVASRELNRKLKEELTKE